MQITKTLAAIFLVSACANSALAFQTAASAQKKTPKPWPQEKFARWGTEALAQIKLDHRVADTYFYYEDQNRDAFSFTWGIGMQMRALAQAAKLDPYRYQARLENLAEATVGAYWDANTNGIGGFSVAMGPPFYELNRYSDENAWLSYSYIQAYEVTGDPFHLQYAKDSLAFALSLEHPTLGGLWWKELFLFWNPQIATCSTAAAALAALQIHKVTNDPFYLSEGVRLLDWLTTNMQDSDGLFWRAMFPDGSVHGPKWSCDSAIPAHAFALLYQLTGRPEHLNEAKRIATAMENRWVDPATGTIQDPSYFGFTAIEAWVCLYEQTQNPRWLHLIQATLEFVHNSTRDQFGRYPEYWDQTPSTPYITWQFHWSTAQPCAFWTAAQIGGIPTTPQDAIPSSSIAASASSHWPGCTPIKSANGSGLTDVVHNNSITASSMWTTLPGGGGASNPHPGTEPGAAWIKYQFDQIYDLGTLWVWNQNQLSSSDRGLRNVTIEYSADGSRWTKLGEFEFAPAAGTARYGHDIEVDFGGIPAKYVVITAHSTGGNWGGDSFGLSEVRFGVIE